MDYVSTRGLAPRLGFVDVMLAGLARDGGLYTPLSAPKLDSTALASLPYDQAAAQIIAPFTAGDWGLEDLAPMTQEAYKRFRHCARAPLVQIDHNLFLLELFHGPTLAFKDFAMQFLGQALNRALKDRGQFATIVGATSGDTGAAAVEAFGGDERTDIFILFPHNRISEVQRRQMTSVNRPGVHAIAIDGAFDDCQDIIKNLFKDAPFRDQFHLSGVNSINFARIAAQIPYYFTAALPLRAPVSFAIPTGNFGDALAGWWAKQLGLPVKRLIIASNDNDILPRTLATGEYRLASVQETLSPAMDIQSPSNFERLLYTHLGQDSERVRNLMNARGFSLPQQVLHAIRADFDAICVKKDACKQEIARVWAHSNILIDPHTAIGVHAAREALNRDPQTPVVALATAHPAKFPDAVEESTGQRVPLPAHLADLLQRPERVVRLSADVQAVADYIRNHARCGS